ncbi:MAG: hypothetical protein ACI4K6_00875 [Candidatus Fimenecus sp.]
MNENKKALQTLIYQGFSRLFVWQGLQGLEVASQPLLRCPKLLCGLERRAISTAAPTLAPFIRRRRRSPKPRAEGSKPFAQTKKKKSRKTTLFIFGRGRRT